MGYASEHILSFNDREHFGRRELDMSAEQLFAECVYQIGALEGLARAVGLELSYLKPHGGLYDRACREDAYALSVIAAAEVFGLPLFGLPGSRLEALAPAAASSLPKASRTGVTCRGPRCHAPGPMRSSTIPRRRYSRLRN